MGWGSSFFGADRRLKTGGVLRSSASKIEDGGFFVLRARISKMGVLRRWGSSKKPSPSSKNPPIFNLRVRNEEPPSSIGGAEDWVEDRRRPHGAPMCLRKHVSCKACPVFYPGLACISELEGRRNSLLRKKKPIFEEAFCPHDLPFDLRTCLQARRGGAREARHSGRAGQESVLLLGATNRFLLTVVVDRKRNNIHIDFPRACLARKLFAETFRRRSTGQEPGTTSGRHAADKPLGGRSSTARCVPPSAYIGFRLFVLPERHSRQLSSIPREARGTVVS